MKGLLVGDTMLSVLSFKGQMRLPYAFGNNAGRRRKKSSGSLIILTKTGSLVAYGLREAMKAASAIMSSSLSLATTGFMSATASPFREPCCMS
jgi:hypothetical protein